MNGVAGGEDQWHDAATQDWGAWRHGAAGDRRFHAKGDRGNAGDL
jgi:hypothetical protein